MQKYKLTTISCFMGIFTQAIVTNITAILFIPLMTLYGFSYVDLGVFVAVNFCTQVSADVIFSGLIDKLGFRRIVQPTCIAAFVGLVLYALTPVLFPGAEFWGVIVSTVIFAFSSGLLEVILSPIIDAIPNDDKGPAMSLMHSFYAWGQAATIIISTICLFIFGFQCWPLLVCFWALVPLVTFFMFKASCMPPNSNPETRMDNKKLMVQPYFIVALIAIMFGGATEVSMNQWISTFLNGALEIPKVWGDLFGMCGFAIMLGLGRTIYGTKGGKINLHKLLVWGSLICIVCYIVVAVSPFNAVNVVACALTGFFSSILWPGLIVVASENFPLAGGWMFAILAAAGDIGCSIGPYITGLMTDIAVELPITKSFMTIFATNASGASMRLGILFSLIFPLVTLFAHIYLKKHSKKCKI